MNVVKHDVIEKFKPCQISNDNSEITNYENPRCMSFSKKKRNQKTSDGRKKFSFLTLFYFVDNSCFYMSPTDL